MPIYEYEPDDRACFICDGRIDLIQGMSEAPEKYCPWCGLEIRRIISKPGFQVRKEVSPDAAAKRGFATFRKTESGLYERVAGEGPDFLKRD